MALKKWNRKHSTEDNWTKEETQKYLHNRAKKAVKNEDKKREGKKYRLVKVCDHPATYKEVEI